MKDYLLISTGKKGDFRYEFDTLDAAIANGKLELRAGNEVTVYVKHSELLLNEITILKSQIQLDVEAKEAQVAEAKSAEVIEAIKA